MESPAASFRAMSVNVTLLGSGVGQEEVSRAAALGAAMAERWETLFSRFRHESLLCRLNRADGAWFPADAEFMAVLEIARAGVGATGGRFDPAVLPALEAAGYDRDIDLVRTGAERHMATGRTAATRGADAWQAVEIDRATGMVRLPQDMRIDLGGIAKGAFADQLAGRLAHWPGGLVDAGGDLRAWGLAPDGGPWRVAVEDPLRPTRDIAFVDLIAPERAGGVATSGTLRRRWSTGDGAAHHLIDPATGAPITGGRVAATVFAPTCAAAEIATKAMLVGAAAGEVAPVDGVAFARLIGADGTIEH
ncbi:MAG: FAD:protein FMN transferase, partial [Thermomicrobiales bacterium]